ncbi:ribose 5-phosphate isomerase B [Candidatus Peregrinibacteria bacterium]|nr:ribose 5-phosphate isomerase B [Candidatus Peregrinibacteria bacterium]
MGEKGKKLVYIGSDHAGFKQKAELKSYIESLGYFVTDIGCFNEESCDYPDIAREVSEKVTENAGAFGVLICGTGEGMAMTANKFKNIRAALATNEELAEMSRKHNDANVLTMGARITDLETMKKITAKFLSTPFESSEERHIRRVNKIGQES